MTEANGRKADHQIDPIFLERWSPRAFTGDSISEADLFRLFEAARWAPSTYNSQPWRFCYARRETPAFDKFLGLLSETNQSWTKNAAALVFVVSKKSFTPAGQQAPIDSYSHSFDTGAAWASLAFQGLKMGWATHGMGGFDHARAPGELNLPEGHRVEMAMAIGRKADKSVLPEALQAREKPSARNPLTQLIFEGGFPRG
ncbi:nitroreductase family protein [Methyloferula stellata]|uniref:nitroreductase family protein n=1 Tax=Methyloferula stellata TaxID=876270 RepID=UPI00036D33A3|nr:nitroreductase family protein [Methyloferula stellata]